MGVATGSDPDLAALAGLAPLAINRRFEVAIFDVDDCRLESILRTGLALVGPGSY
jgi:hypothetical protein